MQSMYNGKSNWSFHGGRKDDDASCLRAYERELPATLRPDFRPRGGGRPPDRDGALPLRRARSGFRSSGHLVAGVVAVAVQLKEELR